MMANFIQLRTFFRVISIFKMPVTSVTTYYCIQHRIGVDGTPKTVEDKLLLEI